MTKMIQTQNLASSLSLMIEEESMVMQKQGIVTILGSDCDTNLTPSHHASSLRRTLSADMSSKKWLSQNMMKKISSSQQLFNSSKTIADSISSSSSSSSSSEDEAEAEAERERLEIWSSIQRNKKEEQEKAVGGGAFDMWNSLVSLQDNNEISKSLPVTPYIHPLVKRSKSCLSEKSLEICTESLGSETGSDHGLFSSYPASETGETEEEKEQEHHQQQQEEVTEEEPRYNHGAAKKFPPRSFPPPLPSLSRQNDGPSLHMRSRRDNGRLVLEAISVPSQNNFCAQRQGGRLVLTLANNKETKEDGDDEVAENDDVNLEEVFGEHEEDEDIEAEDETESVIEKAEPLMSSEITTTTTSSSVHSLALMMNKPIGLVNRNPKWSKKFNEVDVNVVEVEKSSLAQSLPPRPRVARLIPSTPATAAAASFNYNAYEYYWKTKPTAKDATLPNIPLAHQKHNNNNNNNSSSSSNSALNNINSTSKFIVSGDLKQNSNERQQFLVLRRKNGDYLVHNLESCKDSRRSFMFWKPYCIAT